VISCAIPGTEYQEICADLDISEIAVKRGTSSYAGALKVFMKKQNAKTKKDEM